MSLISQDALWSAQSTNHDLTREWSDPTCRNLPWFFFTARVHTTKSTVKIWAANTHYKYFLKIAEVTNFFCTRNRLYQRFVQPLLALTTAVTRQRELDLG
jgi:hypothetical protein